MRLLTRAIGFFVNKRWAVFSFVLSSHLDSHFLLPLLLRALSSTTGYMLSGSRSHTHVPLLVVTVVVALRLAAVSYNEGVSKRVVHFSC